ncbi:MAG TPA: hypothetical protein PKM43_08460 [Verrucomicrobiota bacterium]|nr:hypothetical protein [Verrucomicrobiota bacterium]HRZ36156.1 hypothetical protein [Candidatus Paceibacterota bacterium]HRZ58666.1 hypothetical protein [Candidatus Paceibacterota bacterium]
MPIKREREIYRGRARLETVRRGTGSEHVGVVLETPDGQRFNLVRLGGNPFDDAETRELSGHTVEVEGYRVGSDLRYTVARVHDGGKH